VSKPRPVAYLLTGLPGSGKSTYAKALELRGVVRLSVDDQMTALHGRFGKDYPEDEYFTRLAPVVAEMRLQLIQRLEAGYSVVFDHALRRRTDRDEYKRLVTECGGQWRLIHFQVSREELLRRLAERNSDPRYWLISAETLTLIAEASEDPVDEGEEMPDPYLEH